MRYDLLDAIVFDTVVGINIHYIPPKQHTKAQ